MYDFALLIYTLLIRISAVAGNQKAKKWIAGRKKLLKNIIDTIGNNEIIWVHSSSLGEFEQGRPLIEAIKKINSNKKILLTFYSPSGFEHKKNYEFADYIFYLPQDYKKNAKTFVEKLNIKTAFFIKYDFWKNYLFELKKKEVPTFLISGIFRKNQLFFKPYGKWYKKILYCFTWLFVQDEASQKLLSEHGFNNVTITGDTRIDRVYQIATNSKGDTIIEDFLQKNNNKIIVAGSSWEKDEQLLAYYIKEKPDVKLILAPHEINETHIRKIEEKFSGKTIRYSNYNSYEKDKNVLIVNTIGILNKIYRYATVTYVGGGFGTGIHNILEAAVYAKPVIFGPNYHKFKEANDLIKNGGAFSIKSYEEMKQVLNKLLNDSKYREKSGQAAGSYIEKNKGATDKIMQHIKNYI
jgi:3-deoxy-D-manno-octulosonic-acid transferase